MEFKYKLAENEVPQKAVIASVKEFGIDNVSKYIRSTVQIDRSSSIVSKLSTVRKAIFKEEQLYLKVLVEGKANLYQYKDGKLIRFFYNVNKIG